MNASLPAGFARWSSWPSGADAASALSHCLAEGPHRGDKQETSGALIFHSITRCPNHARTPGKQGKLHRITAVPPDLPRVQSRTVSTKLEIPAKAMSTGIMTRLLPSRANNVLKFSGDFT